MAKINPTSQLITHIIEMSFGVAIGLEHTIVTTEHVLLGMLQSSILRRYLSLSGVAVNELSTDVVEYLTKNSYLLKSQLDVINEPNMFTGQLTAELTSLFKNLEDFAKAEKREVDIADIFLGLLMLQETYASYFMSKYGITKDIILSLRKGLNMATDATSSVHGLHSSPNTGNSALTEYCDNLNEKMKTTNEPLIGRTKEIHTIAHTLCKRKKCNVLLIGDPGVGKSMIVEGLAQRINAGEVPEPLKNKIIFSLDVGRLMAGAKYRGDYEEKVTGILDELSNRPDTILFIDEAQTIDAGDGKGQMGLGLSSMIKPYLSRGAIKLIAATTWEGLRQTFERDNALMRRFRVVSVSEPSQEETIEILKGIRSSNEQFHGVKITDDAIKAAVELSGKYQPEKRFPDKAIDLLDSACARTKVEVSDNKIVDRSNVIYEITDVTGITIKSENTESNNAKQILDLATRLKSIVFHQDKAIDTVSQSLIISQAGLKDPKKPIGIFLLVGPSGVGKTYLAQEVAADLNMNFIKFNMSEYMEKHSVSKLIGAPPGYIGFGDGSTGEGLLINELIRKPNSVVLFDEVEKAHPDIFNIFLQLFDNGEVTGGTGKTANAKNCIFMMTSNLGTKEGIKTPTGFGSEKTGKSASKKAVDDFFLTELRGRMSAIVEFLDLDELSYRRIIAEKISELSNMLMGRNLRLVASETLITHILQLNKNSEYGARMIAGIVSDIIKFPLSVKLLDGTINNDSTIMLDWLDNNLTIEQKLVKVPVEEHIEK